MRAFGSLIPDRLEYGDPELPDVGAPTIPSGPSWQGNPTANRAADIGSQEAFSQMQGLWNLFKAPGEAAQSTTPIGTEEMMEPARNIALLTVGSGMPFAKPGTFGAAGGKMGPPKFGRSGELPPEPANGNFDVPAPLSREERDWQNYGKRMSPDDVLNSEIVWAAANRARDAGGDRAGAFAQAANDLWQRQGANKFITPEIAGRHIRMEEGRAAGIGAVQSPYEDWHHALRGSADEPATSTPQHSGPAAEGLAGGRPAADAGEVGPGGGGALGDGGLQEAQAAAARRAAGRPTLPGQQGPLTINGEHFVPGPIGRVHDVADSYMAEHFPNRPYVPPDKYHPLDPEHSRAIAQAYEDMPHTPDDPATKASYDALIDETQKQYQAIKNSGLKIEPIPPGMEDPYAANPRLAAKDVADNNHLWFFPTENGFGTLNKISDNPMLRDMGETIGGHKLLANDMFRVVHDYFGHLKEGHGFRAAGEDNAWRAHSAMYSDLARPAMTTETRGQNSWVNYGPHGEANRTASAANTTYADQKVGLMPEWTMRDRGSPAPTITYQGSPHGFSQMDISKIGSGEGSGVFGHGLYTSEHSPLAEWYRHQLAARHDPLLEKYGLTADDGSRMGIDLGNEGGNHQAVVEDLHDYIDSLKAKQKQGDTSKQVKDQIDTSGRMIQYLEDPNRAKGHLYQVAIDRPQEHFLDWDKALSGQSPYVQERLKPMVEAMEARSGPARQSLLAKAQAKYATLQNKTGPTAQKVQADIEKYLKPLDWGGMSGKRLYEMAGGLESGRAPLNPTEGYPASTAYLRKQGIAGVRYESGQNFKRFSGHNNYALFDAPRILKRYAAPGLLGGGSILDQFNGDRHSSE